MEYLTTAEFAEKWGISQRRVGIYCRDGRLEGAIIKGKTWLIPADAKKPEDPRRKRRNGKNLMFH
jgi:DNA adenine methylase